MQAPFAGVRSRNIPARSPRRCSLLPRSRKSNLRYLVYDLPDSVDHEELGRAIESSDLQSSPESASERAGAETARRDAGLQARLVPRL